MNFNLKDKLEMDSQFTKRNDARRNAYIICLIWPISQNMAHEQ